MANCTGNFPSTLNLKSTQRGDNLGYIGDIGRKWSVYLTVMNPKEYLLVKGRLVLASFICEIEGAPFSK